MNHKEMLLLIFKCRDNQYAIDCHNVIEVLPRISGNGNSSDGIGSIDYHGTSLPVADFSEIVEGTKSSNVYSTRIIILSDQKKEVASAGLIAENVITTRKIPAAALSGAKSCMEQDISLTAVNVDDELFYLIDTNTVIASINNNFLKNSS